jgi:thiol-disulfide isomerase/thioredoxin
MLKTIQFTLLIALAMAGAIRAVGQHTYTVTGKLGETVQGVIMLEYDTYINGKEQYISDTAEVKNGKFSFSGTISYPVYCRLRLFPVNWTYRDRGTFNFFYLDPGATTVTSNTGLEEATITGGPSQATYTAWQTTRKPLQDSAKKIAADGYHLGKDMNAEGVRAMQERAAPLYKQLSVIDSTFIATHPTSQVAFDAATRNLKYGRPNMQQLETALHRFSGSVLQTPPARYLQQKLAKEKGLQPGKPAPVFASHDLAGRSVTMSSFKGNYVLLAFIKYGPDLTLGNAADNLQRAGTVLKGDNLKLVTIVQPHDSSEAVAYLQEKGLNWTGVIENRTAHDISLRSVFNLNDNESAVYLIGPDGKFVSSSIALDSDIATQISGKIPGAGERIARNSASAGPDGPLNVFVGSEITSYPKVEWLKGSAVDHFDRDTIYIVELWATWCVPCIAAMPHLSELQRRFKHKKVVIIAQQIWEDNKDRVWQFIKNKGADLDYRVAFSGPRGSDFDKRWCVPAQVSGIPRTFVIQDGKLVWDTFPTTLNDAVLQLLVDKQFTIAKAQALQNGK